MHREMVRELYITIPGFPCPSTEKTYAEKLKVYTERKRVRVSV